ncbi:MAG: hypothetical protein KDI51_11695 [Xanthomonadales bacterium]|nr:hypothetical protein [Xanthomonadales bacterium]
MAAFSYAIYNFWPSLQALVWPSVFSLVATMSMWVLMVLLLAAAWGMLLRCLGAKSARPFLIVDIHAHSWLGRYLPAKAGLLLGKTLRSRELALSVGVVARSVLIEQLMFLAVGAVMASAYLWFSPAGQQFLRWGAVDATQFGPIIIGALGVFLLVASLAILRRTAGGSMPAFPIACITILLVLSHSASGMAMYFLASGLGLAIDVTLLQWVGLSSLVNISGSAAMIAPAGLGVREAVMGVALSANESSASLIIYLMLFRLLTMVVDASYLGACLTIKFLGRQDA